MNADINALERLRSALAAADFTILGPVLADDVRFGTCVGRPQVIEHLRHFLVRGVTIESAEVEASADRLITMLDVKPRDPAQYAPAVQRHVAVVFLRDDQIVELQVAESRDQALAAVPSPEPPPRPERSTTLRALAPVLAVRDLTAALEHYGRLGFSVRAYEGGGYGYAERDGQSLHLNVAPDLNPTVTTSAVYLYVDDADSLYAEWRSAGVSGQFFEPHDAEYGLREGAHIDLDGNLIRFGSSLRRPA